VYNATYERVDCNCCIHKAVTDDKETYILLSYCFLVLMCDNKLQKNGEGPDQFPSGTLVWHPDIKGIIL
jgi:hypothetical protein